MSLNKTIQSLTHINPIKTIQLPDKAKWQDATNNCVKLDTYAKLVQLDGSIEESELILDKLRQLIQEKSIEKNRSKYEQKYWIGLIHNGNFVINYL